jgi:hypothetical protein
MFRSFWGGWGRPQGDQRMGQGLFGNGPPGSMGFGGGRRYFGGFGGMPPATGGGYPPMRTEAGGMPPRVEDAPTPGLPDAGAGLPPPSAPMGDQRNDVPYGGGPPQTGGGFPPVPTGTPYGGGLPQTGGGLPPMPGGVPFGPGPNDGIAPPLPPNEAAISQRLTSTPGFQDGRARRLAASQAPGYVPNV